ncbi:MAG TPA: HAD family hydrolase [Chitinophagaceae bacterium]|nr:HAD family hydrolase [Chitinophagaceae bacterium]
MIRIPAILFTLSLFFSCAQETPKNTNTNIQTVVLLDSPLKSWANGPRSRIMNWLEEITDSTGKNYIPEADRIAVFDNDGTLWPEQPIPNQLVYAIDHVKSQAGLHPEWMKDPALKAFITNDPGALQKGGKKGLEKVMALSHSGMSEAAFNEQVRQWIDTAKDSRFGRRYQDLVYQPMLELLEHLRSYGFRNFIVSGGGADFMRVWTEKVYGIPPYQVVGSYMGAKFELKDSIPVITKLPQDLYVDDKEGKPIAIHRFIGKVPVFCGGNSDGDLAMMQYTAGSKYRSMNVLLYHTDAEREYQYDLKTLSGHLEKALVEARERGWVVVDMKKDFRRIFPFEK